MSYNYKYAIVRDVPDSFGKAISSYNLNSTISADLAKLEHDKYTQELSKIVDVINIDSDNSYPDCCFIEDCLIVIGDKALITNPGANTRKGEIDGVRKFLENNKERFGLEIFDMVEVSSAKLDGGDVLYTGRHLFVGLSSRTNPFGIKFLEFTFSDIEVKVIIVSEDLHLKSLVTHLDDKTLITYDRNTKETIENMNLNYKVILVPEKAAANVLNINNTIFIPINCPRTKEIIKNEGFENIIEIDNTEKSKADGALTCCSVLF